MEHTLLEDLFVVFFCTAFKWEPSSAFISEEVDCPSPILLFHYFTYDPSLWENTELVYANKIKFKFPQFQKCLTIIRSIFWVSLSSESKSSLFSSQQNTFSMFGFSETAKSCYLFPTIWTGPKQSFWTFLSLKAKASLSLSVSRNTYIFRAFFWIKIFPSSKIFGNREYSATH